MFQLADKDVDADARKIVAIIYILIKPITKRIDPLASRPAAPPLIGSRIRKAQEYFII